MGRRRSPEPPLEHDPIVGPSRRLTIPLTDIHAVFHIAGVLRDPSAQMAFWSRGSHDLPPRAALLKIADEIHRAKAKIAGIAEAYDFEIKEGGPRKPHPDPQRQAEEPKVRSWEVGILGRVVPLLGEHRTEVTPGAYAMRELGMGEYALSAPDHPTFILSRREIAMYRRAGALKITSGKWP